VDAEYPWLNPEGEIVVPAEHSFSELKASDEIRLAGLLRVLLKVS
jgi:hypothetical protein